MLTKPGLIIAIPKQEKLKKPILTELAKKGFTLFNDDDERGLLSNRMGVPKIGVEFVRAADCLVLLEEKVVSLAFIGSDVVDENTLGVNPRFQKPIAELDLGIAQCGFKIAVPNDKLDQYQKPADLNGLRIATSYPNLLQEWLDKNNVKPSKILVREGGVESSIRQGMADICADLVDTGGTLRRNNLTVLFDIATTSARVYSSPSADYMSKLLSDEFLRYLNPSISQNNEMQQILRAA